MLSIIIKKHLPVW